VGTGISEKPATSTFKLLLWILAKRLYLSTKLDAVSPLEDASHRVTEEVIHARKYSFLFEQNEN
jgi:hypothetical protein